jgi:membrane protease subunit HflC
MREKKLTVAAVFLVCVGLLAYLVVFSVRVDEVAAQYRVGNPVRIIRPILGEKSDEEAAALATKYPDVAIVTRAGWFWKLPWPFDTVKKFDQRVRNVDGPASQTQLPDGNHIIPRVYATWRIYDPVAFQKVLSGDLGNAEDRLRNIIGNETTAVFGQHNLDDVVNTDLTRLKFDQIEQGIYEGVRKDLAQSAGAQNADVYGIEVLSLGIQRIALPDDTTKAVFGRMVAERTMVAGKFVAEGDRIQRTKVAEAKQEQDKILAAAEAEAKDIRAQGEAQAAQYYEVFAKNEHLAVFLRRLESLRKIATAAAKGGQPITLVLSAKTPPFDALESGPQGSKQEAPPPLPLAQEGAGHAPAQTAPEVN